MAVLLATRSLDDLRDLTRQIFGLSFGRSLGVHANGVLGATSTSKGAALAELLDFVVDLGLDAFRAREFALSVRGLEDIAVVDDDFEEAVRQIGVRVEPLLRAPRLVREDGLNKEKVGQRVADGLVDQVDACAEDLEAGGFGWRLGLVILDGAEGLVGEDGGAVAVSLEVDADVELLCGVVQILDTGGCASDRQLERLLYIFGRCAVCIGRLDDTDLDLIRKAGGTHQVAEKGCN